MGSWVGGWGVGGLGCSGVAGLGRCGIGDGVGFGRLVVVVVMSVIVVGATKVGSTLTRRTRSRGPSASSRCSSGPPFEEFPRPFGILRTLRESEVL